MPPAETEPTREPSINYWRLAASILLAGYYISYAFSDPQLRWNFIDSADLMIHESGHLIFSVLYLGQFIQILAGSFVQIALPCILAYYFFRRKEYFSGSVLIFWIGQNVFYVAHYMSDAIVMELPLVSLGGGEGIHDWNYLFTHTGVLHYTDVISRATNAVGFCIIISATLLCLWYSLDEATRKKMFELV